MFKKLIDYFDLFEAEEKESLSDLAVTKINFHRETSRLEMYISGGDFFPEENLLALAEYKIAKHLECDVMFVFTDFSDASKAITIIDELIVNEIVKNYSEFFQLASYSRYAIDGDNLVINSDTINSYSDEMDIKEFATAFINLFNAHTGFNISSYSFNIVELQATKFKMAAHKVDNRVFEKPVFDEVAKPEVKKKGKKAASEGSSDSADAAKEAEEEKVDKNSWAYKAQEQVKINKENNKNQEFHARKNADSLFGVVKKDIPKFDIKDISYREREVTFEGKLVLSDDLRLAKSGKCVIANFIIIDKTGGISGMMFVKPDEADAFEKMFKKGGYAGFQGTVENNRGEIGVKVSGIFEVDKPASRKEVCDHKRVELHAHTKMSEKDAVIVPSDLMKTAAKFGHPACAVTDHGVVQAFPEVYETCKKLMVGDSDKKFKPILGVEGYVVDDGPTICYNLPFRPAVIDPNDPEIKPQHIGYLVSVAIRTTGPDSCKDTISEIYLRKYHLKGYVHVRPEEEGESIADAQAFAARDIDMSLWEPGEYEDFAKPADKPKGYVKEDYDEEFWSVINYAPDMDQMTLGYADGETPIVPEGIEYEFVGEYKSKFTGDIWGGPGTEPVESYFKTGEIVDFIGDAYLCGNDIFNALHFLRKAGYAINIEEHQYYRNKFLMPVVSVYDIRMHRNQDTNKDYSSLEEECESVANEVIDFIKEFNTVDPYEINSKVGHHDTATIKSKALPAYHIIILAQNNLGLYNMYRLISESHVHYYYKRPRMPRSLIKYFQSSIIVGAACERGEVYRYILDKYKACGKSFVDTYDSLTKDAKFIELVKLYEYLEIQPLTNNMFMTREAGDVPLDRTDIQNINVMISNLAIHFGKPCCATTDAHFLNKEDGKYRMYMLMEMGFKDAQDQADLYFRTTEEMLNEFSYLGEERALEVVCTNTLAIADRIEDKIKPFPDDSYPPIIPTAAQDVQNIAWTKANRLYRHKGVLNEVVKARLEKELKSIIGNGFAIMYYIAYRLVIKSNRDGYIVGSRGSVGSSLAAMMCGISEVNPLPPHYRCPKCNYVEFNNTGEYGSGFDLPPKKCPECDVDMIRDGQEIPFETFLGFFGDKSPDIDLNFSGEYQPNAHKYVEVLFGKTHTFRAGTIGKYQDKNAYATARKACEMMEIPYTNAMLAFMSEGIIDVKRTTSQHPGGIVVIPKEQDIYEFTPIQYPANKEDCGIITTHFDFRAMHDTILKLDILAHADPTVLRMLQTLTNIEVTTIPIPDEKVMSLLINTDALGFDISKTDADSATLGLSELGTHMARSMIKETKPTRFFDLVQLMGLSHGTDVWNGNAQDLIRDGICDLNSVIGCRDSIMTRLIHWGLPNKDSFDIMEKVRKGKGLSPEHEGLMRENNVPDWYIDSCKKIKYMFPKAHAAAYSISTLRVAWFKVYYPEEYYCAFFTIRGEEFSAEYMCMGLDTLVNRRKYLSEQMRIDGNPKIKNEFYLCEIVEEMYARGIEFLPINIHTSEATKFKKIEKGKILPPLNIINSISDSIAESIVAARNEAPFANRNDILVRSKIGQSALQKLIDYGLLDGMPESAQIGIFDLLGG